MPMPFQLPLALAILLSLPSPIGSETIPIPGPTFGSGLAGVQICAGNTVILNHTLSATATHGVLHHFWTTGGQGAIDRMHVDYYIDGETSLSTDPNACPKLL